MTGVQVFLMAFGAVLALIGVLVFFLLAWFKESTGQDHHNAIKILQAEFRFSNPALVIFAGGLLLMVAPFFIGNGVQDSPSATPVPVVAATPVPSGIAAANPAPAVAAAPTQAPPQVAINPTNTPAPPTSTPVAPTPPPTLAPTPPVLAAPDPTGRWRNETGFLEFQKLGVDEFAYSDFDSFGNQVGQGTATQEEDILYISGEEAGFDAFGNPYYLAYTGDFIIEGDVLSGDLYDSLGNYLGSVFFTRDPGSLGQ